jgi:hypothetical protein
MRCVNLRLWDISEHSLVGGVQVYDTAAHQRIFTIKRPASAAQLQHAKPHLYWEADSLLYAGWGATITVRGACITSWDGA